VLTEASFLVELVLEQELARRVLAGSAPTWRIWDMGAAFQTFPSVTRRGTMRAP